MEFSKPLKIFTKPIPSLKKRTGTFLITTAWYHNIGSSNKCNKILNTIASCLGIRKAETKSHHYDPFT